MEWIKKMEIILIFFYNALNNYLASDFVKSKAGIYHCDNVFLKIVFARSAG